MKRRLPWWGYAIAAVLVIAAGGLAAWLIWGQAPEDVSNPDAEFTAPTEEPKQKKPKPEDFVWPVFGYTPDRAKAFPTRVVKPPFKKVWRHRADSPVSYTHLTLPTNREV